MDNPPTQVRELGFMILGFTAIGVIGMALIGVVEPGVHRGLMRFLSLIVITSGILMSLMWTGYFTMNRVGIRIRANS